MNPKVASMSYLAPVRRKINKSVIPHNAGDEMSTLNSITIGNTLAKSLHVWWDMEGAQQAR